MVKRYNDGTFVDLHQMFIFGCLDSIKNLEKHILIEYLYTTDSTGKVPAHILCKFGYINIIKYLKDIYGTEFIKTLYIQDHNGKTPYFYLYEKN